MAAKKATARKTTAKKTTARKSSSAKSTLTAAQKRKLLASYSPTKRGAKLKSVGSECRQNAKERKDDKRNPFALPPGKRVSASGNVYYERRANRAD